MLLTKSHTCSTVHAFTSSRSAARHFITLFSVVLFDEDELLHESFIDGLELFELRLLFDVFWWLPLGLGEDWDRIWWSGESLSRFETGPEDALLKSSAAGCSLDNDAVSLDGLLKAGWIDADGFCDDDRDGGVKRDDGNDERGNVGAGGDGSDVGIFFPIFFISCCNSASFAIFAWN